MTPFLRAFYLILIASVFVQIPIYESPETRNTLNLYHVLLPAAVLLAFTRIRQVKLTPEVPYFVSIFLTTIVATYYFGFTPRILLFPFALGAYVAGRDWCYRTSPADRQQTLEQVFKITLLALTVRNFWYLSELGQIYGQSPEANFFFLSSGGRNLEATQLALLAALLVHSRMFLPAIGISGISSILMLSRAGMIATFLAAAYWVFTREQSRMRSVSILVAMGAVLGYALLLMSGSYEDSVTRRFDLSVEQEYAANNQGRLAIWEACAAEIQANPWGHGIGNGFAVMNNGLDNCYHENNSHNVFVELTLDGGVHSIVLFVVLMGNNLFRSNNAAGPYRWFLLIYVAMGMIQFTGYDVIAWLFIGVTSAMRVQTATKLDHDVKSNANFNINGGDFFAINDFELPRQEPEYFSTQNIELPSEEDPFFALTGPLQRASRQSGERQFIESGECRDGKR